MTEQAEQHYQPFKLVTADKVSGKTKVAMSTLRKWTKSRPDRIRLLEFSVFFGLFDSELTPALFDKDLTLYNAIKICCGDDIKVQDISRLIGVPAKTFNSWWVGEDSKRTLAVSMVLASAALLFIGSKARTGSYWSSTDIEVELSNKAEVNALLTSEVATITFHHWMDSKN